MCKQKIKWVNPGRTIAIISIALYAAVLFNINKITDYTLQGSTTYCYQENVEAWWMNRA